MGPPFFFMFILFQVGPIQYIGELTPFGLWILAQIYIGASMSFNPSPALPIGTTLIATVFIIGLLALISIWRFNREEF
ncbi:MAG: hypothetical protein ACXAEF_14765 [Candidatus Thorarchaeota archaeon]